MALHSVWNRKTTTITQSCSSASRAGRLVIGRSLVQIPALGWAELHVKVSLNPKLLLMCGGPLAWRPLPSVRALRWAGVGWTAGIGSSKNPGDGWMDGWMDGAQQLLPLFLWSVSLHVIGSSPCKYTDKTVLMFSSFFFFFICGVNKPLSKGGSVCTFCVSLHIKGVCTHTQTDTHWHTFVGSEFIMVQLWCQDTFHAKTVTGRCCPFISTQQNDDHKGWLSSSVWRHASTLIGRLQLLSRQRRRSGNVVLKEDIGGGWFESNEAAASRVNLKRSTGSYFHYIINTTEKDQLIIWKHTYTGNILI